MDIIKIGLKYAAARKKENIKQEHKRTHTQSKLFNFINFKGQKQQPVFEIRYAKNNNKDNKNNFEALIGLDASSWDAINRK